MKVRSSRGKALRSRWSDTPRACDSTVQAVVVKDSVGTHPLCRGTSIFSARVNAKTPATHGGIPGFSAYGIRSLTITYFHTGIRTIIGVESFHGPVRDGKGWYQ